jgi:hypothetical protein
MSNGLVCLDIKLSNELHYIEALNGSFGGITPYSAQADSTMSKGQPIYIKPNGHMDLAVNTSMVTSEVAGLLTADVSINHTGSFIKDVSITLTDWTNIIGSINLTNGAIYYLDSIAGKLTTVAPVTSGLFVCQVGQAMSTEILAIEIQPKIYL